MPTPSTLLLSSQQPAQVVVAFEPDHSSKPPVNKYADGGAVITPRLELFRRIIIENIRKGTHGVRLVCPERVCDVFGRVYGVVNVNATLEARRW